MNIIKNTKSILCLNGDLSNVRGDPLFAEKDKVIIATDGAADKLIEMGIKPSVIIGDLDSLSSKDHKDTEVIYLPEQSSSDFEKAINYLAENKLLPTVVLGVTGGFIDHILHNINIISKHDCILYAPPLIGYMLKESTTFQLKLNTKISLFAMTKARVRTSGLKWDLNGKILEFPGVNSCFNRTVRENISLEVLEGRLLVLIYLEPIEDGGIL